MVDEMQQSPAGESGKDMTLEARLFLIKRLSSETNVAKRRNRRVQMRSAGTMERARMGRAKSDSTQMDPADCFQCISAKSPSVSNTEYSVNRKFAYHRTKAVSSWPARRDYQLQVNGLGRRAFGICLFPTQERRRMIQSTSGFEECCCEWRSR